jgi:hypothetical protein
MQQRVKLRWEKLTFFDKLSLLFAMTFCLMNGIYANASDLYIDLMKRCLANTIYEDPGFSNKYDLSIRENGHDWPKTAHTMIGLKRLDNIHFCLKEILNNQIPGDCIETGVWRGGATILMKAILKAYGDTTRKVWVADSFEGLPPPNVLKYPADKDLNLYLYKELAVPLEEVKENFKKYDLLDDKVIFLKGFFKDTLPTAPIEQLALLRLDGDLFESTMDALTHLYPKLSVGGFVIIDDYCIDACVKAVHSYRTLHGITDPITPIDQIGVYWKKTH